ncbi:MAG: hypothetical protein FWE03_01430 [Firmicutes bacterium]|nr:hypothetical protein [Bacillota bacterium]
MRIEKEEKGRCEMGQCGKRVSNIIRMDRAGVKSRIYICDECIKKLYKVLSEYLIPKSIETIKKEKILR